MKLSSKMERCGLSPMRKFASYAAKAEERGIKIYHLNIGQPDVKTPDVFFKALRDFTEPVLAYAPSVGMPKFLDAVQHYYSRIGVELEHSQILPTTGGMGTALFTVGGVVLMAVAAWLFFFRRKDKKDN